MYGKEWIEYKETIAKARDLAGRVDTESYAYQSGYEDGYLAAHYKDFEGGIGEFMEMRGCLRVFWEYAVQD